ncbi:PorV/PorQ family protein [Flavisolibacter ginsengisoli]|nr:hypothetical protein [Flavisolibacter ginsengisoli]
MRRLFIYFFFHLIANTIVHGQSIRSSMAAPIAQLLTYSSVHHSPFNMVANQAVLARFDNFSGAVYGEKRFALKELSQYTGIISFPTSSGNFGVSVDHFGDLPYNETGVGLAYGRQLSEMIDIGVQFNYYNFQTQGYGSASSINVEGGILFHLSEIFKAGFHIYNPGGSKIGKEVTESLPSVYSAGFGYDLTQKVFIGASIEKMEGQPLNLNAGVHYYFEDKLSACGGINSANSSYFIGFGVLVKNLRLDIIASMHPQLGISPGLLLTFSPPPKAQSNNNE